MQTAVGVFGGENCTNGVRVSPLGGKCKGSGE